MAVRNVNDYSWRFKDVNIQPGLIDDFTRSDRVVVYVKPMGVKGATFKAVGFIQGLSVDEQKQLNLMFELGSSAPMIIPGLTTGQMSLQRMSINGIDFLNTIYASSGSKPLKQEKIIRSIRDIDTPFSMIIAQFPVSAKGEDGNLNSKGSKALQSVLYEGCQISSRSINMQSGGIVIMENVGLMFTHIPHVKIKAKTY